MAEIMIVEDDRDFSKSLELVLGLREQQALTASSAEEALQLIAGRVDQLRLIFIDIKLPKMDGISCLQEILSRWPNVRCVIMSGYRDNAHIDRALSAGAAEVLLKPFKTEKFLALVKKYI